MTGIYYADLFKINNKGCLIMGYGKSKTCRWYTGEDTEEIGSDSVRFERRDNELIGMFDPTMGLVDNDNLNFNALKVEYLLRMLNESETKKYKIVEPKVITMEEYIEKCTFNICFGCSDSMERLNEFIGLVKGLEVKYLLVPWCDTMEEKGKKIKNVIV